MNEIVWKYYVGKGPEADELLARNRKAWSDVNAARRALADEYHADGLLPGDKKKYSIAGFLYYQKPNFDFMNFSESTHKTPDGRSYFTAVPNMRSQEGRDLALRLAAPEVTFERNKELINQLGLACMADFTALANQTSTSLVWSSATSVGDLILVNMPADVSKQHIIGTSPKIPKFLKLISKSDYDDLLKNT